MAAEPTGTGVEDVVDAAMTTLLADILTIFEAQFNLKENVSWVAHTKNMWVPSLSNRLLVSLSMYKRH